MNTNTIDPLTLPSLPLAERSQLPKCSAVYFVTKDDCILYIGRTANLYQRWLAHHIWQQLYGIGGEIRVAWLECNDSELLPEIEKALIAHFKPLLNKSFAVGSQEAVRVYMSPEKKRAFKSACAAKGLEMSEVTNQLIEEWLKENAVPGMQTQVG